MSQPTQIIVYRSAWEAEANNFWMNNPDLMLYGILFLFVIIPFCFYLRYNLIPSIIRKFKKKNNKNAWNGW